MVSPGSENEGRARVYALLAEALAPPEEGTLKRLIEGSWQRELGEALADCGYPGQRVRERVEVDLQTLKEEYLDAFLLPSGKGLWLVESVYKPWTLDESAELSFKGQTGYLGGDAAAHMKDLLTILNFELPIQFDGSPDHLALELEMMSLLIETASDTDQATFLKQHLDWLPLLLKKCHDKSLTGVYLDILTLTGQFIDWDMERLDPERVVLGFRGFPR